MIEINEAMLRSMLIELIVIIIVPELRSSFSFRYKVLSIAL